MAKIETVTVSEFHTSFDRYWNVALKNPLIIADDGQEILVMLSASEYKRLTSLDDRKAFYAWELPDHIVKALENAEPPEGSRRFDHERG